MKKWLKSPIILFAILTFFFFYKFFLLGLIPLPADSLVSEYNPWKEYSYLGYTPGTYPSKMQYGDVIHQIYPWKTFAIDQIKHGQIPLWNPYSFSGEPFLADIQSAIFQPLNILYLLFSQPISWAISIAFQPFLALVGTYLFTRKIGLKKSSSIISAASYSFCLFMSTFLEYNTLGHILAYLPISLYSIEQILQKVKPISIIIFVASVTLTIFAGHIQLAGFNIIFIILYILFRIKDSTQKISKTILFILLLIISFGVSAIQLIPTIELFRLSARVPQNYTFLIEKLLIQPFQTVVFFSPDFFGNPVTRNYTVLDSYPGNSLYIGLAPIILAICAIFYFKKNKFISFFTISSCVLILLFFRTPLTEIFYKIKIPFFSTGSPTNAIYLLSFSLSILAGFGIEYLEKIDRKRIITILFIIFMFILTNLFLLKDIVSIRNVILSLILLSILTIVFLSMYIKRFNSKFVVSLLILITIADLFFFFQKFNPFVPKEIIFPDTKIFSVLKSTTGISRVWGYRAANLEPNFTTQFGVFSPEGTDPLYPKWYGELIQSANTGKLARSFTNRTRSDAIISQNTPEKLSENKYKTRLLEMLGTKFILDKKDSDTSEKDFPINKYSIFYQDSVWRVFEDKNVVSRMLFAKKVYFYKNQTQFENKFYNKSFNPSRDVIVENGTFSNSQVNNIGKPATLNLKDYSPNKITLTTKSSDKQILFLSDTYYPGWIADIDGAKTNIVKANYAFRAIAVPKGSHTITFSYLPKSFIFGFIISLSSLAALLFLCILCLRKKYFEKV